MGKRHRETWKTHREQERVKVNRLVDKIDKLIVDMTGNYPSPGDYNRVPDSVVNKYGGALPDSEKLWVCYNNYIEALILYEDGTFLHVLPKTLSEALQVPLDVPLKAMNSRNGYYFINTACEQCDHIGDDWDEAVKWLRTFKSEEVL